MDIRTSDADTLVRAAYLLGTIDRSMFTKEQLEIVDSALECIERVKERKEYNNTRQRKYIAKRREENPTYGQAKENIANRGGKRGRPKKDSPEESA